MGYIIGWIILIRDPQDHGIPISIIGRQELLAAKRLADRKKAGGGMNFSYPLPATRNPKSINYILDRIDGIDRIDRENPKS